MLCINSVHIYAKRTNAAVLCFASGKQKLKAKEENTCNLSYSQKFEGSDASIVFKIGSIVGYKRTFQSCI